MKKLKFVVLLLVLVNSCLTMGQDKKSKHTFKEPKLTSSQQLYVELYKKENNAIYIINGIYSKNNSLYFSRIKENEIKKSDYLEAKIATKLYGKKAINGVQKITLKNHEINSLEKLSKAYPFNERDKNEITISGLISNSENKPISGAIVTNLSKSESYKSDFKGKYSLKANKNDILVCFLEGFVTKRMSTGGNEKKMNVVLYKIGTSSIGSETIDKPVIYLYPTQKLDVTINLNFNGELLTTFPKYNKNWSVTAYPDGRIFDTKTNRFYSSLFWDGTQNFTREHYNYLSGFVVSKNDLTSFLIEKLEYIGLNTVETNEFVQYWLPILEQNETNFIHFYINDDYDVISKNNVFPKPETSIRIFMEFYGLDKSIEISVQNLSKTERKGFTLVEWGGSDVSKVVKELNTLKL